MEGLHLTADCFDCACAPALLTDEFQIRALLAKTIAASGLTIVGEHYHPFRDEQGNDAGVTAAVLLAESHVALHTWPEKQAVTLDVYVCNLGEDNSARAEALLNALLDAFQPTRQAIRRLHRGVETER